MELFDLLELRVTELLVQIETLREENKALQEKAASLDLLREENRALQEALEQERQLKEQLDGRINALIDTIRDHLPEA